MWRRILMGSLGSRRKLGEGILQEHHELCKHYSSLLRRKKLRHRFLFRG